MISSDLRDTILSFVDRQISIAEFEEWLVPRLRYYLGDPGATDADIAATIELELVELSEGRETEDDLRSSLQDLVRRQETVIVRTGRTVTSSTSQTQQVPVMPLLQEAANPSTWVPL
jgi:hypothetical protein